MPKYINGPYNYIQLTGFIGTIKKDITIFMDVHLDLNNQTRCESFDSIDISQYLYNLIKQAKIPLDFFLEIREEQLIEPLTNKRDIYISEIIEMFKSEFIIERDKVKYAKSNNNVRLHYLDIRDHLDFFQLIDILKKEINPRLKALKNDKLIESDKLRILDEIKHNLENIKVYVFKIIEKYTIIKKNNMLNFENKTQEYYLNKIIHNFKHKSLKENMNLFLNKFFLSYLSKFNSLLSDILLHIVYFKTDLYEPQETLSKLFGLYNKFYNDIYSLYAIITDVYFLRRILDKDYIKNVITYCGRNHAINYIYFFVKYCNFTITKIYDNGNLTLDDITKKINDIKETEDIEDTNHLSKIYNLFLFEGEKPKQCVTIPNYELINLGW